MSENKSTAIKAFVGGGVATLLALAVGAWGAASMGLIPANADAQPSGLERKFAHKALNAWLDRNTSKQDNPIALSDDNLLVGMKLYRANCQGCHGDQNGKSAFGAAFYPGTPQFTTGKAPHDADAILHTEVVHGVRLTGMPAFGNLMKDDEIWQTVLFIKNLNSLPAAVD